MIPALCVLVTSLAFGIASCICFLVSFLCNYWYIIEKDGVTTTYGLWKVCVDNGYNKTICKTKNDLMTFSVKKGTDPIIMCMAISVCCTLILIDFGISMYCCCSKKPIGWRKTAKMLIYLATISVTAAIDGMLYTEIGLKQILSQKNTTRGWAYMVAWAGTGLQVIMFVLVFIQLCVNPRDRSGMNGWS